MIGQPRRLGRGRLPLRLLLALAVATVVALVVGLALRNPSRGLPFADKAATGSLDGWTAYSGDWQATGGEIRNSSVEPGAKLLAGSPYATDYTVDADVQLLGGGDAGLVLRVSDAEWGADAYNGYYAGLRTSDQSLVLGKAEYGWLEFPSAPMPGGVVPGRWYHLAFSAYGCQLRVTAADPATGSRQTVAAYDPQCLRRGRFGLRSLLAGGRWRNVRVARLTAAQGAALASLPAGEEAPTLAASRSGPSPAIDRQTGPRRPEPVQAIGGLRLLSTTRLARAVVHGTVVVADPLYIQDATGGVLVELTQGHPLRDGEEVEVEGEVAPNGLAPVLRRATLLRTSDSTRVPSPLSITADQAATSAFHAMLVEVGGTLQRKIETAGGAPILELTDGQQVFRALASSPEVGSSFRSLRLGSVLQLRGLCLVDTAHTANTVPFAILISSGEGVKVLTGPPWWSAAHLVTLALLMLGIGFLVHLLLSRAEAWRLRAVIDERERLAHEIHDTLAQSFAGIGFQLRAIRNRVASNRVALDSAALAEELSRTCDLVRQSHDEARRSIITLRSDATEARGLIAALEQAAGQMVGGAPVRIDAEVKGDLRPIPLRVLDSLFRIGQESIANAVQHSHPTRLRLLATYSPAVITLLVEDDGSGFVMEPQMSGFGLSGIRRRAEAVGGQLSIETAPGRGTRVRVQVPLPSPKRRFWVFATHQEPLDEGVRDHVG